VTIDTLAYSRDMERVGFAPEQARGMAEALDKALSTDPLVTRDYLRAELAELRADMRAELAELRAELGGVRAEIRGEIGGLRTELRGEIGELRAEMIKDQRELAWKMAGLLLVQAGAIVALLKLLP
jgi:hypothetical protein